MIIRERSDAYWEVDEKEEVTVFSTELIWGEKSSPKLQNYNPLLTATPKQFIYSLLKNKKINQIKQVRIKYSRKWQNNNKTPKAIC